MSFNHRLMRLCVFVFAVSAAFAASAQETVVSAGTKHSYVYFGDHEIYFRPETRTYFWRNDSGWHSGSELPAESRGFVAQGGLTVELDTERPYERHEIVVARYAKAHPKSDATMGQVIANTANGSTAIAPTSSAHPYVYYGKQEIYYAPETKTWFWRASGKWESGTELPVSSRGLAPGDGMALSLNTEVPYSQHDFVVAEYERLQEQADD